MKKLIFVFLSCYFSIQAMDTEKKNVATNYLHELIVQESDYNYIKLQEALKAGADINAPSAYNDRTPLESAALFGKCLMFNYLAQNGAKITPKTLTCAVTGKQSVIMEKLIKKYKLDVNSQVDGYTPLRLAIRGGDKGLVALLLIEGAIRPLSDYGWGTEMDTLLKSRKHTMQ